MVTAFIRSQKCRLLRLKSRVDNVHEQGGPTLFVYCPVGCDHANRRHEVSPDNGEGDCKIPRQGYGRKRRGPSPRRPRARPRKPSKPLAIRTSEPGSGTAAATF